MIKISDRCKCCNNIDADCYILFVVGIRKSDKRKNIIVSECPCFNCVVLAGCTTFGCKKLSAYHQKFYKPSVRKRYINSKPRDYTKWKTI